MRSLLALSAVALILIIVACGTEQGNLVTTSGSPYYANFVDAKAAASISNKAILVDFYTDGCTWCKRLDTVVLRDEKAVAYFSDTVILAKVNAEVDTDLAKSYNVSGYPTAVLIGADGNEIDRVVGYADTDEYLQTIRDYLNGIGTLDDLLEKIETGFTREIAFKIGDKYKYRGKKENAIEWFDKVIASGEPTDSLSGAGRMAIADAHYRTGDRDEAVTEYDNAAADLKGSIYEEDALIWPAYIQAKEGDTANAISRYEDFLKTFPESDETEWVQGQIDKLNGKTEKIN